MAVDNNKSDHNNLHIKKDASQELRYYYNREERLSWPAASKIFSKKVKEKKIRRSSLIILLDIILIVIAFILFRIFLFGTPSQTTLAGFSFSLKQIITQEAIVASITVKRVASSDEIAQAEAYIIFSLPDSNKNQYATLQLPQGFDKENISRVNFPYSEHDKILKAHITVGKFSEELSIPIKK